MVPEEDAEEREGQPPRARSRLAQTKATIQAEAVVETVRRWRGKANLVDQEDASP